MSRARRVLMTGFWTAALYVVSLVSQVLTVPFFLKAWSQGTYNDWIELTALVFVLQYADGGMQQHVINLLTQQATQERWEDFRTELASATLMYLLAIVVAFVGTAGLCGWVSLGGHFHGRPLEHQALAITALLGIQVTVQLLLGFVGGMYRAFGRADLTTFAVLILRSLLLIGTVAVLVAGRGAQAMALLQLGLFTAVTFGVFVDVRRRYPQARLTLRGARLSRAIGLLRPSLMFMFVSLSTGLTLQGTILVLGAIIPTALVTFTTTRTVSSSVRQVIGLFNNSAWPELTRIDAQGDKAKFALAHRVLVKVTSTVALPIATALLFAGIDLYNVWTRGRATADPLLLKLLLLDVLATVPWQCSSYVLAATSRIRSLSYVYFFAGVAHLALSIVALKLFGIWGIGAVMLTLTLTVYGTLVPRWALQVVGESWPSYVRGIYVPYLLVTAATIFATWRIDTWLHPLLTSSGVAALLQPLTLGPLHVAELQALARGATDALGAMLCAALLSWRLLFARSEREFLSSIVTSVLRRRSGAVQPEPSPSV